MGIFVITKETSFCEPTLVGVAIHNIRHCERAKRAWQNKRSAVSLENEVSLIIQIFSNPKNPQILPLPAKYIASSIIS